MIKQTRTFFLLAITSLGVSLLLSGHAQAQSDISIKIKNLNMAKYSDAMQVYGEIVKAADIICDESDNLGLHTIYPTANRHVCVKMLVKQTIRTAGYPALKEVRKNLPRRVRYSTHGLNKFRLASAH